MHGLALAFLIYCGVSAVWNLVDPDAVKIDFRSNMRFLAALGAQVVVIVLAFQVLAVSTALAIILTLAWLLVDVFAYAVHGR